MLFLTNRDKITIINLIVYGEMSEWSNEHDWKSCIRHKRIGGSNPPLSAIKKGCRAHPFFMGKVIIEGDLMGEQIAVAIFLLKQT